ncbi:MAG: HPr(Ser) kinase/phosphatase [Sphaerochaetaceae bacterium]|nr:HPr(Ser) kinase/phosphatase [Sphaerochaetaceae bacterium]
MSRITVLDLLDLDIKENNNLKLKCVSGRSGLSREIVRAKISRPGLPLFGYYADFKMNEMQLLGYGEQMFISELEKQNRMDTLEHLFQSNAPCIIMAYDAMPSKTLIELSEKNAMPILTTALSSTEFVRHAYAILEEIFAKSETIHGTLMEVFGIGILLLGNSGVGKSETALELIERGHRLIADDAVLLKNISDSYIIGCGPNKKLAHHMEIRGLGIINIFDMYGIGAIREKKHVQLVVNLEAWEEGKNYDRVGETMTMDILGITLPRIELPVQAGRNIPILIETAARNERLKKIGYHSAERFDRSVKEWLESEENKRKYYNTYMREEDGEDDED